MDEPRLDEPHVIPTADQVRTICRTTDPAVRAWLTLERVMAETERLLGGHLREHGLTRAQLSFLLTIGAREGLTQGELAAELGLTKANVSQVLDRLEDAGLVSRVPVARAYGLHLTAAARGLLATVMPEHTRLIADRFAALTATEQRAFARHIELIAGLGPAGE